MIRNRLRFVLGGFRRILTGTQYIAQIDGLRFVAIFSVLLFHLHSSLAYGHGAVSSPFAHDARMLEALSKRGVELFFAISGFILALPFASARKGFRRRVSLKDYFLRRVTRLEPPYILNLILICVIGIVVWHTPWKDFVPHLASSILYVHNIVYQRPSDINAAAWSLEVEIQFYLAVPLLTCLFSIPGTAWRRGALTFLILASGLLSWRLFETPAQLSLLFYLNFFLAGFLFCDLFLERGDIWNIRSYWWDCLALGVWPLIWLVGAPVAHVAAPFAIVLLYMAAFRGKINHRVFSHPWIATIGGMCYSIYLFQFLGFGLIGRVTKPWRLGDSFALYYFVQGSLILPGILAISTFFYLAIERPCMDRNWPRKLWNWMRGRSAPARADTTEPDPRPTHAASIQ